MPRENFHQLEQLLEEDMERLTAETPTLLSPGLQTDMSLQGAQVTLDLAQSLECLAPFGNKNPKPIFLLQHVEIMRQHPMGDGRHIRFLAVCQDGFGVECVLFNRAKDFQQQLYGDSCVDLAGCVDFQEWRGNKKVQFTVETVL